jgi:aryl-alcohol dehydrogenase-like predicted oxidoreductase
MGIAFVAYSPLGRGFLSGQIKKFEDFPANDVRRTWPRYSVENFQKNLELVKKIEQFATRKGCTPSQLALAWVIAQGDHIFPIPGTKRIKYLEENVGAINVQLSNAELEEIDAVFPRDAAVGTRYPEAAMKILNVNG